MTDAAPSTDSTVPEAKRATPAAVGRILAAGRRLPFTALVFLAILVLSIVTGGLWSRLESRSWYPDIAYGVPAFEAGHFWTPVTGAFFGSSPLAVIAILIFFPLLVGFAEWRIGTVRVAIVTCLAQLVAVVASVLLIWLLSEGSWPWAQATATQLDTGFTAGAVAALAVASVTLHPPWRFRTQAGLCALVLVMFLYVGALNDVTRLIAVLIALPFARQIVGAARVAPRSRPSKREWRLTAVVAIAVITLISLVALLWPGESPLGPTGDEDSSFLSVAIPLLILLVLGVGLRRGKRLAWWLTVIVAGAIVVLELLVWVIVLIAIVFDLEVELDGVAGFVADGVLWGALLALLIVGRRAFRVPGRRAIRKATSSPEPARALALLQRYGGGTISWMTTWPENRHFLPTVVDGYVAFQKHAGVAIALGDPVAPAGATGAIVTEFAAMCDRSGWVPCMFSVGEQGRDAATALGWQHAQVAEDSVVDLAALEFKGKAWQDIRSAINRAKKENIEFRMVTLAEQTYGLVSQIRAISEEWVGDKQMPEMGFTLGGVDEALDPHVKVGMALDQDGVVQGVTSWMPVYAPGGEIQGWTLDLMRRKTDGGFRPVIEFLIASSCLEFKAMGASFASLSGAPLARSAEEGEMEPIERVLELLGQTMEPYYGFRSLHAFKLKFQPRFEPMYLTYRDAADLPRIGIALGRAYLPDASAGDLIRMARSA